MRGPQSNPPGRGRSAGFSMVELLIAAFILAVGILGLSMLQLLSMQANRGSRSMSTAVQVADQMLDQVEMEGRLSWLNVTASQYTSPPALPPLQFINAADPVVQTYTVRGKRPDVSATDIADVQPYFTATLVRAEPAVATTAAAGGGQAVHDFTVTVEFQESMQVNGTATPVKRTVVLSRRVIHG